MINLFNLIVLICIMIPNIIYALKVQDIKPVRREEDETKAPDVEKIQERTALEALLLAGDEAASEELQNAGSQNAGSQNTEGQSAGSQSAGYQNEEVRFELGAMDMADEAIWGENATNQETAKDKKNDVDAAKKKARWKRLNRWIGIVETLGRYACMILMIVPFGVLEFEFSNVENFIIYVIGNAALIVSYWIIWSLFLKKRTFKRAVLLSVLSTCIFLLTGLTLDHWWLVLAALVFGVCHTGITVESVWED